MSMMSVPIREASFQLLSQLVEKTGQPPADILDQALAEYGRKLSSPEAPAHELVTSAEAEILEGPGPIRLPARDVAVVSATIAEKGRGTPRLAGPEE